MVHRLVELIAELPRAAAGTGGSRLRHGKAIHDEVPQPRAVVGLVQVLLQLPIPGVHVDAEHSIGLGDEPLDQSCVNVVEHPALQAVPIQRDHPLLEFLRKPRPRQLTIVWFVAGERAAVAGPVSIVDIEPEIVGKTEVVGDVAQWPDFDTSPGRQPVDRWA